MDDQDVDQFRLTFKKIISSFNKITFSRSKFQPYQVRYVTFCRFIPYAVCCVQGLTPESCDSMRRYILIFSYIHVDESLGENERIIHIELPVPG